MRSNPFSHRENIRLCTIEIEEGGETLQSFLYYWQFEELVGA